MKHLKASQPNLSLFPRILAIVTLALAYYGMAELSRHVATTPQSVTPVWPPEGIATAAVLVFGYQLLPAVLIGSFLANIWAFFDDRTWVMCITSVLQVSGIAIGTTMGVALGKYLFQRTVYRRNPFVRVSDTYRFFLMSAVIAPMVNATVGVGILCLGSRVSWQLFAENWLTWWISNVAGICVFTPALLSWYQFYLSKVSSNKVDQNDDDKENNEEILSTSHNNSSNNLLERSQPLRFLRRSLEASILTAIMTVISWHSFYGQHDFEYILLPCLIWSVFRFGQLLSTNLIVILTMIAVSGTVRGLGKFGSIYGSNFSLLLLQLFIVIIIITILSLVAILSEKQEAIASLKRSKIRLTDKSIQLEISKGHLSETALQLEKQNLDLIESQKIVEKANQAKSDFLTNISHELRTPLNAILCLSQILQESQHITTQEKSDLHTIYQSSSHLLYLIDDILNISKIEAGNIEINPKNIYLPAFISDVARIVQVQAQQKNIEFVYHPSSELPEYVEVDDYRLRQILLNLLSNAIKFTEKGRVSLNIACHNANDLSSDLPKPEDAKEQEHSDALKQEQSKQQLKKVLIHFEVQDSGIGIRASDLETIFLPFHQVGDRHFKAQGTGLGLSISQRIAEMMGSKITVSSEYGVGSTFGVLLSLRVAEVKDCGSHSSKETGLNSHSMSMTEPDPIAQPQVHPPHHTQSSVTEQVLPLKDLAQKLPLKILLAEDNEVNQKVAARLLHRLGYSVDIADNGVKALEMLHANFYDIVLMDIQMPEMNGLETTRHILQDFQLSRRPYIIAVTANAMSSDRQTCLEAGMDDYVSKPINLHLLAEALWRSQHGES